MHKFVLSKEDRAKIEEDKTQEEVAEAIKRVAKKIRG